jgi:quercetin 2,3-dioxygenase
LPAGAELTLPAAPHLHLYVARGRVNFDEATLVDGDAARITASAGATVTAREDAELLVWEMHTALGD